MNYLKSHVSKVVCQDYLNKYHIKKTKDLPSLVKVSLSSPFPKNSSKAALTLLEILGNQKAYNTQSKTNNLSLNLRKGDLLGCKVVLRKKAAFDFFQRFVFEMYPVLKNQMNYTKKTKTLEFQIKDVFVLESTEIMFNFLQDVKTVDVVFENNNNNLNFFEACNMFNLLKD